LQLFDIRTRPGYVVFTLTPHGRFRFGVFPHDALQKLYCLHDDKPLDPNPPLVFFFKKCSCPPTPPPIYPPHNCTFLTRSFTPFILLAGLRPLLRYRPEKTRDLAIFFGSFSLLDLFRFSLLLPLQIWHSIPRFLAIGLVHFPFPPPSDLSF